MGLYQTLTRHVWIAPQWDSGTRIARKKVEQALIQAKHHHPWILDSRIVSHILYPSSWWFWCKICEEARCRALVKNLKNRGNSWKNGHFSTRPYQKNYGSYSLNSLIRTQEKKFREKNWREGPRPGPQSSHFSEVYLLSFRHKLLVGISSDYGQWSKSVTPVCVYFSSIYSRHN